MPDGSSSAAPVIRPGPSRCSSVGAGLAGAATLARWEASGLDRFDRAHLPEIANSRFKREPARKVPSGALAVCTLKLWGALMSHRPTPTQVDPLAPDQAAALIRDGSRRARTCWPVRSFWLRGTRAAPGRRPSTSAPRRCSHQGRAALVLLDDYGPDNGATRVVPRHLDRGEPDEASAQIMAGEAGTSSRSTPTCRTVRL